MNCIKCGREHNDYHFRTLQVQTLHVRDFGKNSRIQALGEFEEYDEERRLLLEEIRSLKNEVYEDGKKDRMCKKCGETF